MFCPDTHEFKMLYFEFKLKWHDRKFNYHSIKPILKSQVFCGQYDYLVLFDFHFGAVYNKKMIKRFVNELQSGELNIQH